MSESALEESNVLYSIQPNIKVVEHEPWGRIVYKTVDKNRYKTEEEELSYINREKAAYKRLKNGCIHIMHDIDTLDSPKILFLEYHEGAVDLYSWIEACGDEEASEHATLWFKQLMKAVSFCHKSGIIHQDIKPENVLVITTGNIKLFDFDLSAVIKEGCSPNQTDYYGTECFSCPIKALINLHVNHGYEDPNDTYSFDTDVWACAMTIYSIYSKNFLPFEDLSIEPGIDSLRTLVNIVRFHHDVFDVWPFVEKIPPKNRFILKYMLHINKRYRLTSSEASDILECVKYQTNAQQISC